MSKQSIFELFISVGNLKAKLKWVFKLKLKTKKMSYWIATQILGERISSQTSTRFGGVIPSFSMGLHARDH